MSQPATEPNPNNGPVRQFIDGTQPTHASLGELRIDLDKIDDQIVELLAKRAVLVREAGLFKLNDVQSAAVERQALVIGRVKQLAEAQSSTLPGFAELVEQIYAVLVPGYAGLQQKELSNTRLIQND